MHVSAASIQAGMKISPYKDRRIMFLKTPKAVYSASERKYTAADEVYLSKKNFRGIFPPCDPSYGRVNLE